MPQPAYGHGQVRPASGDTGNLADILERVLDRGVVIAGDIRVNLLDIELLTIKLRLVVASVDTAREMGIDWWEHDPFLGGRSRPSVESGADTRSPDRALPDRSARRTEEER
ncbi:gas vesicle protein GvpA [Plantactinospora sp. BC1]|uniref:gas vesicle protein n=1 Tax=Plantactinospora sp. BC1 TaxID=2108470 RepID=UPI000D16210E|nr:gas vesicle protein GvpA [Plantactinospora sp. BC1]